MMHGTVITILLFFQLVCGGGVKYIQKLSESSDPTSVGTRISSQFLSANPMSYAPSGWRWVVRKLSSFKPS